VSLISATQRPDGRCRTPKKRLLLRLRPRQLAMGYLIVEKYSEVYIYIYIAFFLDFFSFGVFRNKKMEESLL
jgi:hypothetical protein